MSTSVQRKSHPVLSFIQQHHVVLVGPNGAGKTTHGRFLAAMLDRQYMDMSRVLKLGSAYDPQLAQEFARHSSNGDLVPDETIFQPLDSYLTTLRKGDFVVASGVPRCDSQVSPFLTALATRLGSNSVVVVDMILDPDDAVRRCKKRAEEDVANGKTPRPDDLDEILIRKRLGIHDTEKEGLLEAFKQHDSRIVQVKCEDSQQQTMLGLLASLGATRSDLFFMPSGFAA